MPDMNNIEAHLNAAKDSAEQIIGKLQRQVNELHYNIITLEAFSKRMARDKLTLTKQNDLLIERILKLENTNVQLTEDEQKHLEAAIALMEKVFSAWIKDRTPASAGTL